MLLDGLERNVKALLDLAVRIAAHDQVDDLDLSRGEAERCEPFVEVGPGLDRRPAYSLSLEKPGQDPERRDLEADLYDGDNIIAGAETVKRYGANGRELKERVAGQIKSG